MGMNDTIKLTLSDDGFDRLHKAAGGRGEFARVSKDTLSALLRDHSSALGKLKEMGVTTR